MKIKSQSGITLVALVVTIVVLLILAGVSINLVLGENGLISNAKEARDKTKTAEATEKSQLDSASDFISEVVNNTELPQTNETKPYMLGDGFTKVDGTNLANGLTIQDSDGNQYVWVEVPMTEEVYPTAKLEITEFNDEAYTKIENDLHTYTSTYRKNTSWKDEYYEDTNNSNDWFFGVDEYNELKQKMLKSVYQNGGFWIGRYEAGISEENKRLSKDDPITVKPQTKQNLIAYNLVTRTQAKKLAEMIEYTSNGTIYKGNLLFGVQWDLVLKFIHDKGNVSDEELNIDSKEIGNYSDSTFMINRGMYAIGTKWKLSNTWNLYNVESENYVDKNFKKLAQSSNGNGISLTTGAADQNCHMNVYDIAGNVWEWTLENATYDKNISCASRGGSYNVSGSQYTVSNRNNNPVSATDYDYGFRICLY